MGSASEDDINRLRIALGRISRTVDRKVAGDGMTRTQLSVLGTVSRAKRVGMSELAEIEGLNPTMLSRVVGKLEVAGLVLRSPGEEDRRAVVVGITAAGRRLHESLRRQRTRLFADRLADLPSTHRQALLAAIPALESLSISLRDEDRDGARAGAGR